MKPMLEKVLRPRILVGAAALLLVLVYFTPLWTISLVAPQYPDGMGMYISVNEIRGHDTHDLQNINILNHYIGMQPVEPEAVPELEYMPLILGGLILTGLLAAFIGNRWVMAAWLLAFLGLGLAGMVDFYMWKHDYGHNLSPDAPIKVPGMTYQPPLIGTKQLLNITASSYPYWGTLILSVAAALGLLGVVRAFRGRGGGGTREGDATRRSGPPVRAGAAAVAALLLVGCGQEIGDASDRTRQGPDRQEAIVYGQDTDPFCGKEVDVVRWGGEIRTGSGAALRFRSIECMAGYLLAGRMAEEEVVSVKVVDFADGWRLIDASSAIYLHTPNLASPDRVNLLSLDDPKLARNLQDAYTGPLIEWDQVLELVGREWDVAIRMGGCEAAGPERAGAAGTCD